MLYLSRGEQAALLLLVALLLAGAGLLTYRHGVAVGRAQAEAPLFVEASAPPPAPAASAPSPGPAPVAAPEPVLPAAPPASALPPSPAKRAAAPAVSGRISLNSATLAQLDTLPGIGPVYAQRIIDYRQKLRKEQGRGFTSVDELLNVSGIGPRRLAKLRDRVVP